MANDRLWLEVSNVQTEGKEVKVQLKGDRADKELAWWEVPDADANEIFRALDSKRTVLAGIGPQRGKNPEGKDDKLVVHQIRIQFSDSGSR